MMVKIKNLSDTQAASKHYGSTEKNELVQFCAVRSLCPAPLSMTPMGTVKFYLDQIDVNKIGTRVHKNKHMAAFRATDKDRIPTTEDFLKFRKHYEALHPELRGQPSFVVVHHKKGEPGSAPVHCHIFWDLVKNGIGIKMPWTKFKANLCARNIENVMGFLPVTDAPAQSASRRQLMDWERQAAASSGISVKEVAADLLVMAERCKTGAEFAAKFPGSPYILACGYQRRDGSHILHAMDRAGNMHPIQNRLEKPKGEYHRFVSSIDISTLPNVASARQQQRSQARETARSMVAQLYYEAANGEELIQSITSVGMVVACGDTRDTLLVFGDGFKFGLKRAVKEVCPGDFNKKVKDINRADLPSPAEAKLIIQANRQAARNRTAVAAGHTADVRVRAASERAMGTHEDNTRTKRTLIMMLPHADVGSDTKSINAVSRSVSESASPDAHTQNAAKLLSQNSKKISQSLSKDANSHTKSLPCAIMIAGASNSGGAKISTTAPISSKNISSPGSSAPLDQNHRELSNNLAPSAKKSSEDKPPSESFDNYLPTSLSQIGSKEISEDTAFGQNPVPSQPITDKDAPDNTPPTGEVDETFDSSDFDYRIGMAILNQDWGTVKKIRQELFAAKKQAREDSQGRRKIAAQNAAIANKEGNRKKTAAKPNGSLGF